MFDNFKMMGAVASLLKNRDQIKAAGQRIQTKLEAMRITGQSEGKLVTAVVTGKMQVVSIEIAESVAAGMKTPGDRVRVQQLIADAVNEGLRKAQEAVAATIDEEGAELGLPGLGEQLGQLMPR